MREFATTLVDLYEPTDADPDPDKSVNRVDSVLRLHRGVLGERRSALLDALLGYWRACNGVVQRQEHGSQKGNEPLTHEDARRVVLHTAVVMVEIDRTLPR